MSNSESKPNDGPFFKCLHCEEVVVSKTSDWPDDCPHCGESEWMTTMEGIQDEDSLEAEEVPDSEGN